VAAHYDTKDIPKFVGANDGASGTAAVLELARALKPGTIGPGVRFILFDGEESPAGTPDSQFARKGLRGSKVAARAYHDAEAMILLDFVADKRLRTPREGNSNVGLWAKLRAAARTAGTTRHFPDETAGAVLDDHIPFLDRGVPSIDLIDFDFACFHRTCDNLNAVSKTSLDATGETVAGLLRTL
jgi:glutaminyl-peptide cyclotransferase